MTENSDQTTDQTTDQTADQTTENPTQQNTNVQGSAEKDPQEWTTGDEPVTGPQQSYLETLAREAGEQVPDGLTKASASELIDQLQQRTGRGE